jgi:hypothetical protein
MTIDFDALRAKRNAEWVAEAERLSEEWDISLDSLLSGYDFKSCYCDCANGGPCEHDFQDWRDFEDGSGGERFCSRCGMGAMKHTLLLER